MRLLILLCLSVVTASFGNAADKPNVVFVLIDDLGYGDFTCFGGDGEPTPNIDKLAREGIKLKSFYVDSPICSASRAGLFTGNHPARWGMYSYLAKRTTNHAYGMPDWLSTDAPGLAGAFKQAGYATAHFGKWHLGGFADVDDAPLLQEYGFDRSLGSFSSLGDRLLGNKYICDRWSRELGNGEIRDCSRADRTRAFTDETIAFVEEQSQKPEPYFVQLWLDDTHDPFWPSPEQASRRTVESDNPEVEKLHSVLRAMDVQLGRLFDAIARSPDADNTLIVLTSDNGPTAWPSYYLRGIDPPGSTLGFRGRKWSLYEGGIRGPFIAKWSGRIASDSEDNDSIMMGCDLYPTLCSLAGIPMQDQARPDGEDRSEVLLGKPRSRKRPAFFEYGRTPEFLRPGDPDDASPILAMRDGRWKFLCNPDGSAAELYDLDVDRSERTNLAEIDKDRAFEMREQLLAWRRNLDTWDSRSESLADAGKKAEPVALQQRDGRWWFIDPHDTPFVSLGINHVEPQLILGRHNVGLSYKKYGADIAHWYSEYNPEGRGAKVWMNEVQANLQHWGFNTFAYHTSVPLDSIQDMYFIPRIRALSIEGYNPEKQYIDLFEPAFEQRVASAVEHVVEKFADHPYLLGYSYSDVPNWGIRRGDGANPWVLHLAALPAGTPGKTHWIDILKANHASASDAAKVYGSEAETWDELGSKTDWSGAKDRPAARKDSVAMLLRIIERWYSVHHEAIRSRDTDTLIFGDKIDGQSPIESAWPVIGKYVDLMYVQWYGTYDQQRDKLQRMHEATGKPILMGDSSFSVVKPYQDRAKGVKVDSQEAVGEAYAEYLEKTIALPYVVGWHYCGYIEGHRDLASPDTYEDGQSGFLDPWGEPFVKTLTKVREANKQAKAWHGAE